ncbi:YggS family pyridoxal phosphate-dependent enzyme [Flavisolibacter tropicus]|uniref:Pyridoxal phosphate homeostasis protein n=1 Tax=Flavisolibacter tropicus TaxID=1492898 RepID=A0A172TRZ6_9BACT|nr:YggS family pyridoxal phosphate-dependent enzyme [Flavisolibacter tropicus]ANE49800.1 alanine racemase [Flavisolibacter tropicus]
MLVNKNTYQEIGKDLNQKNVTLVAVSKTKPVEAIQELYELGQRDFGENYVQELIDKQSKMPSDIRWHFIGHLQSNKVKYIAPFVHLIHGVDSYKLLKEINKQGEKQGRVIDVLMQIHIAQEETKFGLDSKELEEVITQSGIDQLKNVRIRGLMGMASFSDDQTLVRREFQYLRSLFNKYNSNLPMFTILSMGMSGDYQLAVEEGSTMVRIGSLLFGARNYQQ